MPILNQPDTHPDPDLDQLPPAGGRGWEARARAWYGWQDYSHRRAPLCPRVLLGLRCRIPYRRYYDYAHPCICERHHDLLDHAHHWRDEHHTPILTGEPYGVRIDKLTALRADCAELGLEVELGKRSPYYPSFCTLIIIRPARTEAER